MDKHLTKKQKLKESLRTLQEQERKRWDDSKLELEEIISYLNADSEEKDNKWSFTYVVNKKI